MNKSRSLLAGLLFLIALVILFVLGYWQLTRGLEKAEIARTIADRSEAPALISEAPADWFALQYQKVRLAGRWHPDRSLLLDNRLLEGRPGYEILTPFELTGDGTWLLVNRGWLEKPYPGPGADSPSRNPEIAPPTGSESVFGEIYLPQTGFTLGPAHVSEPDAAPWPKRVLYYDFEALSALVGQPLAPATVVLSANSPHTFTRIWAPANMPPSRHYGYAVQWWGLMLTLIIFGLIWQRQARRKHTELCSSDDQSVHKK